MGRSAVETYVQGLGSLGAASGAHYPKSSPTCPAAPVPPAEAELCEGKAWPQRAYNSHNAAPEGRGELQLPRGSAPRSAYSKRAAESRPGLASKQRPGGKRASSGRNVPGSAALPAPRASP